LFNLVLTGFNLFLTGMIHVMPQPSPPPPHIEVGAGTSVWTVEGDKEKALGEDGEGLSDDEDAEDTTKILLDKEFDDFYEDQGGSSINYRTLDSTLSHLI
jgi:hypothetical protein